MDNVLRSEGRRRKMQKQRRKPGVPRNDVPGLFPHANLRRGRRRARFVNVDGRHNPSESDAQAGHNPTGDRRDLRSQRRRRRHGAIGAQRRGYQGNCDNLTGRFHRQS